VTARINRNKVGKQSIVLAGMGMTPTKNGVLAEALFELADSEPPGDRRVALLKAGYTAFDSPTPVGRGLRDGAPAWLRPLIEQLTGCRSEDAVKAAVQRLRGDGPIRRRPARQGYLCRTSAHRIVRDGDPDLHPSRLRGACHWHTNDSDGKAGLEAMARACARRGHAWSMVTDHSRGLEVASGLDREGLRLQRRRIDKWNRLRGEDHRLFQGLEVEVRSDGTLDVPKGERLEVECVVAAVHSAFDPDRDQTDRLIRAVSTPGVHVLAHPRGRHFHYRPGLKARWELVFAACEELGVAVEINGFPRRQDLDADLARLAADAGCEFLLASDAHAVSHLEFDTFASAIAMQAGVPRDRILNIRHADEIEAWLEERSNV
jgi:histidinol phosphatase-like PHP family hydrolase